MLNRRQGLQAAAALAALGLSCRAARAGTAGAVVALAEQRSRFLVNVEIDGAAGYRFVLDTGATAHFISTRLVDTLRLPPLEERMVRGFQGRNRDTVVGLARFNVGGVEIGRSRAVAWAPERLDGHDGLIGYPFLLPRAVVALAEGRISLGAVDAPRDLAPVRAEVLPNQALLLGGMAGADGRFVFDTGSQACTISSAYYDRIKGSEAYKAAAKLVYRAADGSTRIAAFRPAQMRFGDLALAQPVVRVAAPGARDAMFHEIDGLFGVDLLRQYTWVIDQAAGSLQAGAPAPLRLGYFGAGLSIALQDGVARISAVVDDGPAFEAGVRPGQRVLSLMGGADGGPGPRRLVLLDRGGPRAVELQARALL